MNSNVNEMVEANNTMPRLVPSDDSLSAAGPVISGGCAWDQRFAAK